MKTLDLQNVEIVNKADVLSYVTDIVVTDDFKIRDFNICISPKDCKRLKITIEEIK